MNQATSRDFPRFTLIFPFFLCGHHQALNDFILFFPFDLKWNQFLIFFSLIYLVHPFLILLLEVLDFLQHFQSILFFRRWKIINFLKIKTYFKTPDREETAENTKMSEKQTRGGKMLFSQRWSLHNFEFQIVPL